MTHDLYNELTTAATGTDCGGIAAWLQTAMRIALPDAAARAEAYWAAVGEDGQYVICGKLGITEPVADALVHDAIMRDFTALYAAACDTLDFKG